MSKSSIVASILALLVFASAASAHRVTHPTTTSRQAERNILRAQRMLARWHVGLVDTGTGLVKPNTTAQCRGRGRGFAHRKGAARAFFKFSCVIVNREHVVQVLYYALTGNGFEMHNRVVVHR
ncbi:MAG TPA: hypothetical protein VFI04_04185 [Gaiellaceae bacterium]|jgi:hypothetical protein|nr:hypothetical protein [Gaiellaceae bacterium]